MVLSIAGFHPHSFQAKVLILGASFTFLLFLYLSAGSTFSSILSSKSFAFETKPGTCPPRAYANGKWTGPYYRTDAWIMTNKSQAMTFAGFEGCASSREFDWHLASDTERQWNRFPDAQSFRWTVGKEDGCDGLLDFDKEQMVQDLVDQGGWLLLGDSITEGHFFSLSCTLYPHVIATPKYKPNSWFDRAWYQDLYLNPESPLLRRLRIPPGFNITTTPLATYRRIDLLFERKDLEELHRKIHPTTRSDFSLFSEEETWSLSPNEYMPLFFNRGYSTLVINTAGHWTTTLFGGYGPKEPAAFEGAKRGIDGVIDFFGHAMRLWADEVQGALRDSANFDGGLRKRQVVIRAYLPGHDSCRWHRKPLARLPMRWPWNGIFSGRNNWAQIWKFNEVFEVGLLWRSFTTSCLMVNHTIHSGRT